MIQTNVQLKLVTASYHATVPAFSRSDRWMVTSVYPHQMRHPDISRRRSGHQRLCNRPPAGVCAVSNTDGVNIKGFVKCR